MFESALAFVLAYVAAKSSEFEDKAIVYEPVTQMDTSSQVIKKSVPNQQTNGFKQNTEPTDSEAPEGGVITFGTNCSDQGISGVCN